MNKLKSILDVCTIIAGLSFFIHFIIVSFLLIWSRYFCCQQEMPLILKAFFSSGILFVIFGLLNAIID